MEHPDIRGLAEWRLLAAGTCVLVWEARQPTLERQVAVKVYERQLDDGVRRRFLREVAAAARLSAHPGIVTTHDAGLLPDGRPYLIMDLYPGGSLAQWFVTERRPSEERVRQIGVRTADALAAVHACGLLHRDLGPANILIDSYGNPGIASFGLAALGGPEADGTEADLVPAASAYAPPEAFGTRPVTEAGDVYSLAATLHALLAGWLPRQASANTATCERVAVNGPREPLASVAGVDPALMDVVMSALSDDPAARPTAAGFRDELAALALVHTARSASSEVTAEPDGSPGRAAPGDAAPGRGVRRAAALALVAASIAVLAPAGAWLVHEPGPAAAPTALSQDQALVGSPSGAGLDPARPTPTATATATAGKVTGSEEHRAIALKGPADSARPFENVRIEGLYRGGADTFLRVQRWERGRWLAFPLPAKTDHAGKFATYVELGRPGRYRLRVLDHELGVTSKLLVLVVED